MIRLLEGGALRSVLPAGRDVVAWHAALSGEIAAHLSPGHAAVLARPEPGAGGVAWVAEGTARTRYADLLGEGRRALDAALGAVLSDIRRLAESGVAPAVREAWPALREVPDMGHVFAVDGRPVLAGWGHVAGAAVVGGAVGGASGRLARLDDGVAWRATPQPQWRRYGMALGALAVLALVGGLLLPLLAPWLVAKPASCMIVPGQLEALRGQMELDSRGAELRTLLATLTEEVGRKQLTCPIVPAAAPPPAVPVPLPRPAPPPPSPPPPQPRADLPRERWDQRDLSMLEGCWSLTTTLTVWNHEQTRSSRVRSWRMCFDGHGAGHQTIQLDDGRHCEGPLGASFGGDVLRVTEPQVCDGPNFRLGRTERLCRRLGDSEAECNGHATDDPEARGSYTGRFRR